MKILNRFLSYIASIWEPLLGFGLVGSFIVGLLVFKLGNLVPGFNSLEIATMQGSNSLSAILSNPINAPYKIINLLFTHFHLTSPFAMRGVSVLFGAITIALFYYVLSRWHTARIALLGTILFATSSVFLHYARLAEPSITSMLLISALAYGSWLHNTKKPRLSLIIGIILAVALLYIPGIIWFFLVGCIWQRKLLLEYFKKSPIIGSFLILLGLILLAPLGYGLYTNPSLIKSLVGFPIHTIPSIFDYLKNLLNVFVELFVRGPADPVVWLGRLPLLDIFTIAMCLLGIFVSFTKRQLDRNKMLIGSIIGGILLVGLGGSVSITILIPFIYILASSGITLMLQQWFTVYPRNPIARTLGASILTIAVLMTCFYHINSYFIAWPNAVETKQAFQLKQ